MTDKTPDYAVIYADFARRCTFGDLPAEVVAVVKKLLLDELGWQRPAMLGAC